MKQLIWKELREQRFIPLAFAALIALVVAAQVALSPWLVRYNLGTPVRAVDTSFAPILALCLLGIFPGSGAIAPENGNGTIGFLTALPAGRPRIWLAKVVAGSITMAVSIIVSIASYVIALLATFGERGVRDVWNSTAPMQTAGWYCGFIALVVVYGYAVSLFVSAVVDRTLVAAVLGLVVSIGVFAFFTMVGINTEVRNSSLITNLRMIGLIAAFMAASYIAFCSGEPPRPRLRLRRAFLTLAVGLGVAWICLTALGMRMNAAYAAERARFRSIVPQAILFDSPVPNGPYWGVATCRVIFPRHCMAGSTKIVVSLEGATDPHLMGLIAPFHIPRNPKSTATYGDPVATHDSDAYVISGIRTGGEITILVIRRNLPGTYHHVVAILGKGGKTLGVVDIECVAQ